MPTETENPSGFTCTRCGACCKNINTVDRVVLLTPDDIYRLDERLAADESLRGIDYIDAGALKDAPDTLRLLKPKADGVCPFLSADNLCRVHDAKPHQCRNTPFRFLWGAIQFDYECTARVVVPLDWTSDREDAVFVAQLGIGA